MIAEIISPNVTYLTGLGMDEVLDAALVHDVRIHKRGVIEINTNADLREAVDDLFTTYEAAGHLYPVDVTGFKPEQNYLTPKTGLFANKLDTPKVGSHRLCAWEGAFAKALTNAVLTAEVPELYEDGEGLWEFQQVSKYFRFMRYDEGGEHFPHYDSDFVVKNGDKVRYATKYSLVMYFNDCETGEIAFIDHDGKDKSDWPRQAHDHEIFLKIKPRMGKIVLFPHDVCHTVLPFTDKDSQRFIMRGDLIFTKAE